MGIDGMRSAILNIYTYCLETGMFKFRVDHVETLPKARAKHIADRAYGAGYIDSKGYRILSFGGKQFKAHRVAWLIVRGRMPDGMIDHINGIPDDNRIENLRAVSFLENSRNMAVPKRNKSGQPGVYRNSYGIWISEIRVRGAKIYLGSFRNLQDAVAARKIAEREHGFHENHGRPNTNAR